MAQSPMNNIYSMNNGVASNSYTNYTAAPIPNYASTQTQSVKVEPQNTTSQIYQYPSTSLYEPSKQASSGVNIYIYNPTGMGGPSSNSTANATYALPGQNSHPIINNNIPAPQVTAATTPIANTSISENPAQESSNQKTKNIVELTDDYIKTLENYLRSPDASIRKSGINELIKRYEEDKSRYDDPALTALLNIALQDTDPNNRMFAMSTIAGGSAHGDENTVKLLQNLQSSDKLYGQEAKMANDALLNSVQTKIEVPDDSIQKENTNTENK